MSLLREIQDAAASDEVPVTTLLRKARILATRLHHEPLQRWVTSELEGYADGDELPDYRRQQHVPVKAHFSGPFNSGMRNADVPPACVEPGDRESLFTFTPRQPVAAIEDLLRSGEATFTVPWSADVVVYYADRIYEDQGMMQAWKVIPRGKLVSVVDGVRNRLLSFALELEQVAPEAGEPDADDAMPPQSQVTQIFHNHIQAGQAVIAGRDVQHATQVGSPPAAWPDLRQKLESWGIPAPDLDDLRDALVRDNAAESGIGENTQGWLGRLAGKLGTGTLVLGAGVTTEIVAAEVAKALGMS